MFKSLLLIIFTFITSGLLFGQQNEFEIQGNTNNLYLEHTVSPKENFYSLGRMYNVNPKELAAYNHLHFQSGLDLGQSIKIPLTKTNFTQISKPEANYNLIPLYHTVATGETLYRLGVNYHKVSLAALKKWNNMTSDAVSVGNRMIVGYLKVDKQLSSLNINNTNATATTVSEPKESNPVSQPVMQAPQNSAAKEKSTENTATSTPSTQTEEPVAVQANPVNGKSGNFSGGVFKQLYSEQTATKAPESKSGTAGVFKSTSGWQDGKYYCFSNDAAAGTILKISNSASGKSVYAKVLDTIPDIQQNSGLIVVISNAAASELGTGDNKFDCSVAY